VQHPPAAVAAAADAPAAVHWTAAAAVGLAAAVYWTAAAAVGLAAVRRGLVAVRSPV
jgi:hypothetical protein